MIASEFGLVWVMFVGIMIGYALGLHHGRRMRLRP